MKNLFCRSMKVLIASCFLASVCYAANDWRQSDLYFGTNISGDPSLGNCPKGTVSDKQFNRFVAKEITPRFPDGLTRFEALGQFLQNSKVVKEKSHVVIILYPLSVASSANQKLNKIRQLYEKQFCQESVLRVDTSRVTVSF